MKTEITPGPWRVQADPLLAGRHPLHANRFITTNHQLETWRSSRAEGHGDDCCGFEHNEGTIICTMTDSEHQKANAKLIAAAPQLLAELVGVIEWLDTSENLELAKLSVIKSLKKALDNAML